MALQPHMGLGLHLFNHFLKTSGDQPFVPDTICPHDLRLHRRTSVNCALFHRPHPRLFSDVPPSIFIQVDENTNSDVTPSLGIRYLFYTFFYQILIQIDVLKIKNRFYKVTLHVGYIFTCLNARNNWFYKILVTETEITIQK